MYFVSFCCVQVSVVNLFNPTIVWFLLTKDTSDDVTCDGDCDVTVLTIDRITSAGDRYRMFLRENNDLEIQENTIQVKYP